MLLCLHIHICLHLEELSLNDDLLILFIKSNLMICEPAAGIPHVNSHS